MRTQRLWPLLASAKNRQKRSMWIRGDPGRILPVLIPSHALALLASHLGAVAPQTNFSVQCHPETFPRLSTMRCGLDDRKTYTIPGECPGGFWLRTEPQPFLPQVPLNATCTLLMHPRKATDQQKTAATAPAATTTAANTTAESNITIRKAPPKTESPNSTVYVRLYVYVCAGTARRQKDAQTYGSPTFNNTKVVVGRGI